MTNLDEPIPDLWADEDLIAYLEDLIRYYRNEIDEKKTKIIMFTNDIQNRTTQIADAEEQIQFLKQKIQFGDATCGCGLIDLTCQCEGCRFERGELRAPNLKAAIARRPLVPGKGYIYEMREKQSRIVFEDDLHPFMKFLDQKLNPIE